MFFGKFIILLSQVARCTQGGLKCVARPVLKYTHRNGGRITATKPHTMNTHTLQPGDKLLHRGTHESLTYVQPFDSERIFVTDSKGETYAIHTANVVIDHDRQFIKSATNFFSRLWNHLLATK